MSKSTVIRVVVTVVALMMTLSAGSAGAAPPERASDAAAYWTAERMANAVPRDLVLDHRGLAYLRTPAGLQPYGHDVAASAGLVRSVPIPRKPPSGGGGGGDTTGPSVSLIDPPSGATIGYSHTFSATVTDTSGVKSVGFELRVQGTAFSQTFTATSIGNDVWAAALENFSNASWEWRVIAKDNAGRGGNTTTTDWSPFTVDTSGQPPPPPPPSGAVTDADWTAGGNVSSAAGRIYFEMPGNSRWRGPWTGYVCSGTAVTDQTTGRSLVITAAHCVYDDANKAFARNVLFIPQQQDTTGTGTDLNCNNDPIGCWTPRFGVVDRDWTTRTFPANIPWDFAFYVFDDSASHSGAGSGGALDGAVSELTVVFNGHTMDDAADAIGYSYSQDPALRYCREPLGTESSYGDLWLGSCGLTGGSSGGPWLQPAGSGSGSIISVNSWGYTNQPGMGGPKLNSETSCLFGAAKTTQFGLVSAVDGYAGVSPDCS